VQRVRGDVLEDVRDVLDEPDCLLFVLEERLELGPYQLWGDMLAVGT
jgi:hypothetical protein